MYTNIHYFFTTYAALACIIHMVIPFFDITYICLITFTLGSYLSFVNPKKYHFIYDNTTHIFKGWKRFFTVDILHALLFVYGLYAFQYLLRDNNYDSKFMISFVFTMVYVCIISIENVYKTDVFSLMILSIIVTITYIIVLTFFPKYHFICLI